MKKFFGLALAGIVAAGAVGLTVPANKANADEAASVIKPFALYEFNDAANPGKDTSGNGYDLVKKTMGGDDCLQIKEENGEKYLSLDSKRNSEGGQSGCGGILYAPALRGKKDFSDMLRESYTIEIEFRRDNSTWMGDHYLLQTGKYNNSFGMTPWKNGIEYQVYNQAIAQGATDEEKYNYLQGKMYTSSISTKEWTKVIVVGNADEDKVYIYENGNLVNTIDVDDVLLSYPDQAYTFCIGGQAEYDGNASTMFATADVKRCAVYDTALSAANVQKVFNGEDAVLEDGQKYIASVSEIDLTNVDLKVTDVNTLDVIMNENLPQQVKVTFSDGKEKPVKVFWYEKNGTIKGYLQSAYANPECKTLSATYGYALKFKYDENLISLSDITLDDEPYVLGTDITGGKHEVAFKVVTANNYITVNDVLYNDISFGDEDGIYYVDIKGGAVIEIDAIAKKFTVTYKDGAESLGTSKYTYGGSEALKQAPEKVGFTFEGWYLDEALSEKFTSLDYQNPKNLTLYAKYVKSQNGGSSSGDGSSTGGETGGGCGGSISAMSGALTLLGAAAVAVLGKRKIK